MPEKKKNNNTVLSVRASIAPESFNEKEGTVDVVFATATPVRRYDWYDDEVYNEVLSFDDGNIRMERLNNGAPVLNSHSGYDLCNQIGVVVKAWVEKGEARATLKFSERNEEIAGFKKDIQAGIIRNVSVGYNVHKFEKTEATEDKIATWRAIDWEPYEISMVPIPADPNSTVRSHKPNNKNSKKNNMAKNNETPEQKKARMAEKKAQREKELKEATQRAAAEGAEAERKRCVNIKQIVRKAGILKAEFADKLIKDGVSTSKARKLVIDELAKSDSNFRASNSNITIKKGTEETERYAQAVSDAILLRAEPSFFKGKEDKISDKAKEFRGLTLLDMARESCENMGVSTRGMSKREIARAALLGVDSYGRAYMSISDFPNILGTTVNRTLRMAYDLAPRTFMPFCRQVSAADFRPMIRIQTGDVSSFTEVKEGGEYKRGVYGEAAESYVVKKYGEIIPITWEALVNDDLGAFSRIPRSIGEVAAQKQSDIVWGIILGNPAMADGTTLFHTNHKNVGTTGALSITTLSEGRKLMRKQKSIGGLPLNLSAEFLIVAPEKEMDAYQFTSKNYVPVDQVKINPDYNTNLKTIVEPRLSDSTWNNGLSWMLSCSPNRIDTIEYAFLEGDGELFTEQRIGFDVDGVEIKARMAFGAKALDWRGFVKNTGA